MASVSAEERKSRRLQFLYGVEMPDVGNGGTVKGSHSNNSNEQPWSDEDESQVDARPAIGGCTSSSTSTSSHEGDRTEEDKAADNLAAKEPETPEDQKTSNMQTLANLVKCNIGTGILSLPYGFRRAGLLIGTLGTLLVGFVCTFCMHQLLKAYERVADGRLIDYADVTELVFAKSKYATVRRLSRAARLVTNAFVILTQMGLCSVYVVFVAKMTKEIVEDYVSADSWAASHLRMVHYEAAVTLLLIPYCFVTTLRVLSFFSMLANFLIIACLVVIMQYVLRHLQPIGALPLYTQPGEFFTYFGSAMFAYSSIVIVMPLRIKMRNPQAYGGWNGVMSLGMTVTVIIYAAVGFYGYLAFGQDAVLILSNLPQHWVYHCVKVVWSVAIFLTYNLQLYVPVQIIYPSLRNWVKWHFVKQHAEYLVRMFLVLVAFVAAATIPCVELMITLVGALAMGTLALCLPATIDLVSTLPMRNKGGLASVGVDKAASSHNGNNSHHQPQVVQRLLTSNDDEKTTPCWSASGSSSVSAPDQPKAHHFQSHAGRCYFAWVVFQDVCIFLLGLSGAVIGTYITLDEVVERLQSPDGCG